MCYLYSSGNFIESLPIQISIAMISKYKHITFLDLKVLIEMIKSKCNQKLPFTPAKFQLN